MFNPWTEFVAEQGTHVLCMCKYIHLELSQWLLHSYPEAPPTRCIVPFPSHSQDNNPLTIMFASLSKAAALAVLVDVASSAAISGVSDSSIAGRPTSDVFPPAHSR